MKKFDSYGLRFITSVIFSLLLVFAPFQHTSAAIDSCTADVSPQTAQPNAQVLYNFTITNGGPNGIAWIQILRPSGNFIIGNAAWTGSSSVGNDQATLYDGLTIAANESATIGLSVHAGEDQTSGEQWTVLVSENSDGSDPVTCTGSLDAAVAGDRIPDPDTTPPQLGPINLSALKSTSINIDWSTDEPSDSDVAYGETSDYGMAKHDTAPVTDHSLKLENLKPDTSYHFFVTSYDPSGNGSSSNDGTFLTPSEEPGGGGDNGSFTLKTIIPLKTTPSEKIAPTIRLITDVSLPQKPGINLSGIAEDNEALAGIYYSLDNGSNWLPVDQQIGLGTKKATFSFKPSNLQDGNYKLSLRAVDTSSNRTDTPIITLVIDRLPPTVGGSVVAVGSQALLPDGEGVINSLIGVDQKITLSAVGGPTSVTILTTEVGKDKILQSFNLTQSPDNGLWSGILSYSSAGTFQLVASSIDGANNHTRRLLNVVNVSEAGKVTDMTDTAVKAKISVYTLDTESNTWVMWDGEAYDQPNPVAVSNKGKYGLYLPKGKYYFKINAAGYQDIVTHSFNLDNARAFNGSFKMRHKPGFFLGPLHVQVPWPVISGSSFDSYLSTTTQKIDASDRVLPQFSLMQTNGKLLKTAMLYGKPTILTFINTWSTAAANQLESINEITEPNINVVAVGSGESLSKLSVYALVAGFDKPIVADVDNQLMQEMQGTTIPVTYFIDRHGMIKKVMVGVLSKEELSSNASL